MYLRNLVLSQPGSPSSHTSRGEAGQTAQEVLKTTLKLAEKLLDGIPIPGAKGAIGGLLEVIGGLEKMAKNRDDIRELEVELLRLTNAVLTPLGGKLKTDISPELKERVEILVTEFEVLPKEWKKFVSHSRARRFFERDMEADVIISVTKKLRGSLDAFGLSGDMEREIIGGKTLAVVQGIDESVNNVVTVTQELALTGQLIERTAISNEELNLLDRLPTVSASYDSNSVNATTRCFSGTREQLIATIKTWLEHKQGEGSPVFWLNGIAGIGKSTVARTIAEFAENQRTLGASFFFSRTEGRSDPAVFFTTLAYQLACVSPLFKTAITNAIRNNLTIGQAIPRRQIRELIVDPLRTIYNIPYPVVIVVDALDECYENGVEEILIQLFTYLPSLPSFKILITGRPEFHITSILNSKNNISKIFMHDIEKSILNSDITTFLEFCLNEITALFPGCKWFWTAEELARLARLAGTLFIYAVTAINFIKDRHTYNPRKQLKLLLEVQNPVGSPSLPFAHLDVLYDQVVDRAVPIEKEDEIAARFRVVLGVVVGSKAPLSLQTIEKLMELEEGDARAALIFLPSVIAVPESSDDAPCIYHPSFPDYITNSNRCKRSQLVIHSQTNHLQILQRCFAIMNSLLKRDIANIANSFLTNSEIQDLEAKVQSAIPPWLRYSILHWPAHLMAATADNGEAMVCLETFCGKNLLHWIEACTLLGSLDRVIPLIRQARGWAGKSTCSPKTLELLDDTLRLIPAHYDTIQNHTLHLYHSVLPFLPSGCAISTAYKEDMRDSDVVVVGGREESWNPCVNVLQGHSSSVTSVKFSQDGTLIVSGCSDNTVKVWDATSGQHMITLKGHVEAVNSVSIAPDGKLIVSGSDDKTARIWDVTTGQQLSVFKGHTDWINSVSFSEDGAFVVSGSKDRTARVWVVAIGRQTVTLEGHSQQIYSASFSRDANEVVTSSGDRTVRVWVVETGLERLRLEGHHGDVYSALFSQNGKFIVSGGGDKTVRMWDSQSGHQLLALDGHPQFVTSVSFSQDGIKILSASNDHTARIWDVQTGQQLLVMEGHSKHVLSASFSQDDNLVVSSSQDTTARVWDARASQHKSLHKAHRGLIRDLSFSKNGELVVSASADGTAYVWDTHSGQQMVVLEGHAEAVYSASFSWDEKQIVTGSGDYTACVWDIGTGLQLLTLEGHTDSVWCVSFSRDRKLIASGSCDHSARIWDGDTGQEKWRLEGHSDWVRVVSFSQNGELMVSGSDDNTARVWNTSTGHCTLTMSGHSHYLCSALFSEDGQFIVSGSADQTVRLWDTTTGHCIDTSNRFFDDVTSVKFYSTNPYIIQVQLHGQIHYWTPFIPSIVTSPNIFSFSPSQLQPKPIYSIEDQRIMISRGAMQTAAPIWYIPPSFSSHRLDLCGTMLVMGSVSGEVLILKLPGSTMFF